MIPTHVETPGDVVRFTFPFFLKDGTFEGILTLDSFKCSYPMNESFFKKEDVHFMKHPFIFIAD